MLTERNLMAGLIEVFDDSVGLIPAPWGVVVLYGRQLLPGDVLSSCHYPLWSLMVDGVAIVIPSSNVAS